jgi:aldose 1-epimerase
MAEVDNYDNVFPTGKIVPVKGTQVRLPGCRREGARRPVPRRQLQPLWTSKRRPIVVTITDPAAHYGVHIEGLSPNIKTIQVYAPPAKSFVAVEHQFNFADPFGKDGATWTPAW